MGASKLLLEQKLTRWIGLLVLMILTGCKEPMVNYNSFLEKPSVTRKQNTFEINLGFTPASANWIKPTLLFKDDVLYISGKLTFKESPNIVTVQLPDPNKRYRVYWVDGDGKKTEITIRE